MFEDVLLLIRFAFRYFCAVRLYHRLDDDAALAVLLLKVANGAILSASHRVEKLLNFYENHRIVANESGTLPKRNFSDEANDDHPLFTHVDRQTYGGQSLCTSTSSVCVCVCMVTFCNFFRDNMLDVVLC